jgi:hypothetical protein
MTKMVRRIVELENKVELLEVALRQIGNAASMGWSEYHASSEEYAKQAEQLSRQGETDRAVELYNLAAKAEIKALSNLEPGKSRIMGITAVSAVFLCYKAKEPELAKRIAQKWLASELLPPFAAQELEDLLQTMDLEENHYD